MYTNSPEDLEVLEQRYDSDEEPDNLEWDPALVHAAGPVVLVVLGDVGLALDLRAGNKFMRLTNACLYSTQPDGYM